MGKHVAPHATEVAAIWAVLTRLKRPLPDRYQGEVRELVDELTPLDKLRLYDRGAAPDRLALAQAKVLRKHTPDLFHESDVYPNYEGRIGASARELMTALLNAAQASGSTCLTPRAVLEELTNLCRDKTVHDFLQQEVVEGYHDHEEYVRVVEAELLDRLDEEIRDSMGLVSEAQYLDLFQRYVMLVSHWVKGERVRNRITGELEPPDEGRMIEMERIAMPSGEDRSTFRRGLISAVGAFRLDHPDAAEIDYGAIFPDLFRRLQRPHLRGAQAAAAPLQGAPAPLPLGRPHRPGREGAPPGGDHPRQPAAALRLLPELRPGRDPVPHAAALRRERVRRAARARERARARAKVGANPRSDHASGSLAAPGGSVASLPGLGLGRGLVHGRGGGPVLRLATRGRWRSHLQPERDGPVVAAGADDLARPELEDGGEAGREVDQRVAVDPEHQGRALHVQRDAVVGQVHRLDHAVDHGQRSGRVARLGRGGPLRPAREVAGG